MNLFRFMDRVGLFLLLFTVIRVALLELRPELEWATAGGALGEVGKMIRLSREVALTDGE